MNVEVSGQNRLLKRENGGEIKQQAGEVLEKQKKLELPVGTVRTLTDEVKNNLNSNSQGKVKHS